MADWTFDYKESSNTGELIYLEPDEIIISRRGDVLKVTVKDDRSYLKVHAVRVFPLTNIDEYISLFDAIAGREIGVMRNLRGLDPDSRRLVQEDLNRRYFIPKITHIYKAKKEFGTVYWDVETDRGRREFVMRGIRDSIHEIEPGRYLVIDVDGNRFEVPQLGNLDNRSQSFWDKLI